MPWFRKAKEVLDSGRLGEVLDAEFKLRPGDGQGADAYLARQPYFQKMPKFLVHETAIHLVDTFRYLFGEPTSLYADLRRCNSVIAGEDAGVILFEFPNNLRVTFNGNRLLDHGAENTRRTLGELEIIGTFGELRLNGLGELWFRAFGKQARERIVFDWQDQNFGGDCVFNTIKHIAEHYTEQRPIENQGSEYIRNIEIENAIYDSAASGQKCVLEP